jgi:hypothetical protein
LERHYKKLKSRLGRSNISSDKRYEMEDEEDYDEFRANDDYKIIYRCGNKAAAIKKKENGAGYINTSITKNHDSSSDNKDIIDKYNRIIIFNEENLPKIGKVENGSDISDYFSGISPLLTYDKYRKSRIRKNYNKAGNKTLFQRGRIDSFSQPRSNSKVNLYKYK